MLSLPDTIVTRLNMDPGTEPTIWTYIKDKVNEVPSRLCALTFGEIPLSPKLHYDERRDYIIGFEDLGDNRRANRFADAALVFMIRGIMDNWQQILAFYFVSKPTSPDVLKEFIPSLISQLQNIGLDVWATVCAQTPNNQTALTELCAKSGGTDSYIFTVNEKPICVIYDAPSLFRDTRNAFVDCSFKFASNKIAEFSYLRQAYDQDSQEPYPELYKLSADDFTTTQLGSIKLPISTCVNQLGREMASCIWQNVKSKNFPDDALHTAEFCVLMNKFFDSFNGTKKSDLARPFRIAASNGTFHLNFWNEMLHNISEWELKNVKSNQIVTDQYPFIEGWQISLKSFKYLLSRIMVCDDYEFMPTGFLNLDSLENLFTAIQKFGSRNTDPTCKQFADILKITTINNDMREFVDAVGISLTKSVVDGDKAHY